VGVVLASLTKNSRNFVYPERLSRGATLAPLFATLCKEQNVSPIFPIASALFAQNSRVSPNASHSGTRPFSVKCHGIFFTSSVLTILALVLSLTDDCGLMTDDCLHTDDYFLNRSIGVRRPGHWLAPSEGDDGEGSLVTGHCLCYNSARRGTCREASPPASASRSGRGPIRLFPFVFDRVAWGGRFALLSPVLAETRISPVQTHLQSVRLLHVLRGLRLSAAAPLQSSVTRAGKVLL